MTRGGGFSRGGIHFQTENLEGALNLRPTFRRGCKSSDQILRGINKYLKFPVNEVAVDLWSKTIAWNNHFHTSEACLKPLLAEILSAFGLFLIKNTQK